MLMKHKHINIQRNFPHAGSGVQEALRQRRREAAQEAAQPGPVVEGAEQANQVREAIKFPGS